MRLSRRETKQIDTPATRKTSSVQIVSIASSIAVERQDDAGPAFPELRLLCPDCRGEAATVGEVSLCGWVCPSCGARLKKDGAIVKAFSPGREQYYAKFFEEYLTIRRAEGRGSADPAYYLALPYEDISGRLSGQWAIRGKSYRYFERNILPGLERRSPRGLSVLDLGAGTGWLSYRLALRGHTPAAVDLLGDAEDGLGAASHHFAELGREFPLFQAEFDRLPFADQQFDLAVFNSSFHYSTDYRDTLQEARRCLRWGGRVVIIDSPIYRCHEHGEQMREERQEQFQAQYGFRSDSIPSIEYLDQTMLAGLSKDLSLQWEVHRPWYGLGWHLRPLKAWWGKRRPPSRFQILVGTWMAP